LGNGTNIARLIKENATIGSGAGIQRHDVFRHSGFSFVWYNFGLLHFAAALNAFIQYEYGC
jgi:hypothetical protein